ncbi:MAG: hypothetical protein V7605_2368 [Acidimicrobiaceae bacterium]
MRQSFGLADSEDERLQISEGDEDVSMTGVGILLDPGGCRRGVLGFTTTPFEYVLQPDLDAVQTAGGRPPAVADHTFPPPLPDRTD